jgi:hypothetical protein
VTRTLKKEIFLLKHSGRLFNRIEDRPIVS